MKRWYVGYFYHGYLSQLKHSFEKFKDTKFEGVRMWYPEIIEVVLKDQQTIKRKVPLFENYMLFEFEEGSLVWTHILRNTPVIKFFKDNKTDMPIPLYDKEVEFLKEMTSRTIKEDPARFIGKEVIINSGPYKGMVGKCKKIIKGKYSARVDINIMDIANREVIINLEKLEILEAYNGN